MYRTKCETPMTVNILQEPQAVSPTAEGRGSALKTAIHCPCFSRVNSVSRILRMRRGQTGTPLQMRRSPWFTAHAPVHMRTKVTAHQNGSHAYKGKGQPGVRRTRDAIIHTGISLPQGAASVFSRGEFSMHGRKLLQMQ